KKPKIPSFESKSYEPPRPDDRSYGTGAIEVLPGESLAKHSRRHQHEAGGGENALEDKNAPLGAVAEEAPDPEPEPERQAPPAPVSIPPEVTEGGVVTEATASKPEQRKQQEDESEQKSGEEPSSSARITDRSDKYPFAHRSSNRRGRRGRSGPPPVKQEEHRT